MVIMKFHPVAQILPEYPSIDTLQMLAMDIEKRGQRNRVTINVNGELLDGRARALACLLAGVEPNTDIFKGTPSQEINFIFGSYERKHPLTKDQKAMILVMSGVDYSHKDALEVYNHNTVLADLVRLGGVGLYEAHRTVLMEQRANRAKAS